MNKGILQNKQPEAKPDAEMPELSEADFARAKPNRFAKNVFQLDDDVSAYFKTSKEVKLRKKLNFERS